jgi:hypothetical protein
MSHLGRAAHHNSRIVFVCVCNMHVTSGKDIPVEEVHAYIYIYIYIYIYTNMYMTQVNYAHTYTYTLSLLH